MGARGSREWHENGVESCENLLNKQLFAPAPRITSLVRARFASFSLLTPRTRFWKLLSDLRQPGCCCCWCFCFQFSVLFPATLSRPSSVLIARYTTSYTHILSYTLIHLHQARPCPRPQEWSHTLKGYRASEVFLFFFFSFESNTHTKKHTVYVTLHFVWLPHLLSLPVGLANAISPLHSKRLLTS